MCQSLCNFGWSLCYVGGGSPRPWAGYVMHGLEGSEQGVCECVHVMVCISVGPWVVAIFERCASRRLHRRAAFNGDGHMFSVVLVDVRLSVPCCVHPCGIGRTICE